MQVRPFYFAYLVSFMFFLSIALGALIFVLASVWLRGTSISGLIDGVLLRPLRHADSYSYPVDWRPGTVLLAIVFFILGALPITVRTMFSRGEAAVSA